MTFIEVVKWLLTHITLVAEVLAVLLLISLFVTKNSDWSKKLVSWVSSNAVLLSFIVAAVAMLGSLFYSEVAGYAPCLLCWYQRIFMYSAAFLLGMALVKNKDAAILPYTAMLSVVGGAIALFHYIEQMSAKAFVPCEVVGYSASCTDRFFTSYGHITIPWMAFAAFVLIILFYLSYRRAKAEQV